MRSPRLGFSFIGGCWVQRLEFGVSPRMVRFVANGGRTGSNHAVRVDPILEHFGPIFKVEAGTDPGRGVTAGRLQLAFALPVLR